MYLYKGSGVVTVTDGVFTESAAKDITISESGYYTNCKKWDLVGVLPLSKYSTLMEIFKEFLVLKLEEKLLVCLMAIIISV